MAKKEKVHRKPIIGGQAVIEGVMMRSPTRMAIAVRQEDGEIKVHTEEALSPSQRYPWMGWIFIRGVVGFVMSLKLGMITISKSTEMLGLQDDQSPSRFERWVADTFGMKAEKAVFLIAMILAVCMAVGLFVVVPSLIATGLRIIFHSDVLVNILEGLVRFAIFIVYIASISLMKEIRRVFQYHGAEHKVVHCYEQDEPLTVENARKYPTLHPRCGTAFLLIIMALSIFFFSVFGWNYNALTRIVSRLAFFPLIAGISYEILRLLAFRDNGLIRILRAPGLLLQKLTTREPDDAMLEVAIRSFKAAQTGESSSGGAATGEGEKERVLL